jgi:hypothetical protein
MMSFQEFKNDYYTSNKELLSKVEPNLHNDMMLSAYTKHRDKLRCSDYYEENKEKIRTRHKEYYEQNKEKLQQKQKIKYEENKKEINDKRKEIVECECGCYLQKWHISRHMKTAKHTELLNAKNGTKQQQEKEQKKETKTCNSCNVDLIENYKPCECRRCEDWGGCKYINGYYFLMCPKCKKDFGTIKTDNWESSYKRGMC